MTEAKKGIQTITFDANIDIEDIPTIYYTLDQVKFLIKERIKELEEEFRDLAVIEPNTTITLSNKKFITEYLEPIHEQTILDMKRSINNHKISELKRLLGSE